MILKFEVTHFNKTYENGWLLYKYDNLTIHL
jgi:hypothetical protein